MAKRILTNKDGMEVLRHPELKAKYAAMINSGEVLFDSGYASMMVGMQSQLTFAGVKQESDLDKQVPLKPVEQIVTNKPLENAIDLHDVTFVQQKTAALYHGVLYTVVPVEASLDEAITPDVQGFEKRRVLLWDDYNSLFKFDETIWQKVSVQVPKDLIGKKLFKETGDVYSMEEIPVGWAKEQSTAPRYVE